MAIPHFVEKDYQQQALAQFDTYIVALKSARAEFHEVLKLKRENPTLPIPLPDYPSMAWAQVLREGKTGRMKSYSSRTSGDGLPVPNCTFKIPTGGGKTYIGAAAVARIVTQFIPRDEPQFILWIVPSQAIYEQTKRQLSDREHPFRQLFDRVSGGRVRILEKDSPLHADDVRANLCIMLLMLPSANRENKEVLKVFRDRGNVNGFLPLEDDQPAHAALVRDVPNLDYVTQGTFGIDAVGIVKSSLGNALRLIRPVVVMDEGQKAFSAKAHETLYGFNPRFVIELSATPKDGDTRWANWIVNIDGRDLDREEMIKMPIVLHSEPSTDWRDCLRHAWEQTQSLQREADTLLENTNRYVRPILLVQVERTGKEQAEGDAIHADHARRHLLSLGLEPEAIRLKTAEVNEIANIDLFASDCPVRVIITKSALQEGWDCSFAYVLCSLIPARSVSGMTQMVGRILRQPEASRTGVPALDRCYVFTPFSQTREVFIAIKRGLEGEGMGDLTSRIVGSGDQALIDVPPIIRERRDAFRDAEYALPTVAFVENGVSREVDWEGDILGQIDWGALTAKDLAADLPLRMDSEFVSVTEISVGSVFGDMHRSVDMRVAAPEKFDLVYAVRVLNPIVPNPFIAARLVTEYLDGLRESGWEESEIAAHQRYIVDHLCLVLGQRVEATCKIVFERHLDEHRMRFNLRTDLGRWLIPETSTVNRTKLAGRDDGNSYQASLFEPQQEGELNGFEYKVAGYVDRAVTVEFWYRNVVHEGYKLQGWRKPGFYPDFIIAKRNDGDGEWLILETKGEHLNNADTAYKREVAERLMQAYQDQRELPSIGELQLVDSGREFICQILMESDWKADLSCTLAPA